MRKTRITKMQIRPQTETEQAAFKHAFDALIRELVERQFTRISREKDKETNQDEEIHRCHRSQSPQ